MDRSPIRKSGVFSGWETAVDGIVKTRMAASVRSRITEHLSWYCETPNGLRLTRAANVLVLLKTRNEQPKRFFKQFHRPLYCAYGPFRLRPNQRRRVQPFVRPRNLTLTGIWTIL